MATVVETQKERDLLSFALGMVGMKIQREELEERRKQRKVTTRLAERGLELEERRATTSERLADIQEGLKDIQERGMQLEEAGAKSKRKYTMALAKQAKQTARKINQEITYQKSIEELERKIRLNTHRGLSAEVERNRFELDVLKKMDPEEVEDALFGSKMMATQRSIIDFLQLQLQAQREGRYQQMTFFDQTMKAMQYEEAQYQNAYGKTLADLSGTPYLAGVEQATRGHFNLTRMKDVTPDQISKSQADLNRVITEAMKGKAEWDLQQRAATTELSTDEAVRMKATVELLGDQEAWLNPSVWREAQLQVMQGKVPELVLVPDKWVGNLYGAVPFILKPQKKITTAESVKGTPREAEAIPLTPELAEQLGVDVNMPVTGPSREFQETFGP